MKYRLLLRLYSVYSVLIIWAMGGSAIWAASRTQLGNGLVVLVQEDHSEPTVALQLLVHVGGHFETEGTAGFSHFIEHLVARHGEDGRPNGDRRRVAELGGSYAIATSFDRTYYRMVLPTTYVEEALTMLSGVLRKGPFIDTDVEKERTIIFDEMRNRRDRIETLVYDEYPAVALAGHPQARSPMGTFETVQAASGAELNRWYSTYYVPNNATLAIVGDVRTDEVLRRVRARFGHLAPNHRRPPKPRGPKGLTGYTFRSERRPQLPRAAVVFGWLTPGFSHPDRYAMEVAYHLLGSETFGRLSQALIDRDHLADQVLPNWLLFDDLGLMYFTVRPRQPEHLPILMEAFVRALIRLRQEGIGEAELRRIKKFLRHRYIFSMERSGPQAEQMAVSEYLGGIRYAEAYLENVERVTCRAVQAAMARYLQKENLKILTLVPTTAAAGAGESSPTLERLVNDLTLGSDRPKHFDLRRRLYSPLAAHRSRSTKRSRRPLDPQGFRREVLENGLTLLYQPRPGRALVSVALQLKAGSRYGDKAGLSKATALMLWEGTTGRDKGELMRRKGELGGVLDMTVDRELVKWSATFLVDEWTDGLGLLGDVVQNPRLDGSALASVLSRMASVSKGRGTGVPSDMDLLFRRLFENQSEAQPIDGTVDSLATITREDVQAYHRQNYRPDRAVLAVAGDVPYETVRSIVRNGFAQWKPSSDRPRERPVQTYKSEGLRQWSEKAEGRVTIGFPLRSALGQDYPLKSLLTYVLYRQINDDVVYNQGLSHEAVGYIVPPFPVPVMYFYATTAAEHLSTIETAIVGHVNALLKGRLAESDLDRYKKELLGINTLHRNNSRWVAEQLALYESMGMADYSVDTVDKAIGNLRAQDLVDGARRMIDTDKITHIVTRPRPAPAK